MIGSVQALRAIAALAVMACHFDQLATWISGHPIDAPFPLYPLGSGVDLFFVISGFIMVRSSGKFFGTASGPMVFFVRRIARIVPFYWLATFVSIPLMKPSFSAETLINSLFFWPATQPIYGVGWTLNYEMFFYVIFAAGLLLPRRIGLPAVGVALCAIVPFDTYWSDPIILEFILGMGMAWAYEGRRFVIPLWAQLPLLVAAVVWMFSFSAVPPPSGWRIAQWGMPSALLFAAVVFGPDRKTLYACLSPIGDVSYSIYLLHSLVGALVFLNWQHLSGFQLPKVFFVAAMVTIFMAFLSFRFIESPVNKWARGLHKA